MPIAAAVVAMLDGRLSVDEAIEALLTRPFKAERLSDGELAVEDRARRAWSWDDQVKARRQGRAWTGVRNHTARRNLKEMKKGDRAFFYHSGDEKRSSASSR